MSSSKPTTQALHIRPAVPDDAVQLTHIHLRAWQATYRDVLSANYLSALAIDVETRTQVFRDAIIRGLYSIWVVEQEGRLVAWASFGASRDAGGAADHGELRSINLLPEVWSQGIGRQLWLQVRKQLLHAGYRQATVWVIPGNARAIGFYQALGFAIEPDTATTVIDRGEPLPLVRYRTAL